MDKVLDGDGLKHLYGKIKQEINDHIPSIDQTLTSEDGNLGVAKPVNDVLTREEFDALSPEKKNHGLYIIRGEGEPLAGLEIEEYDTTVDGCDWHVRKWSNGYCELFASKNFTGINVTNGNDGIYTAGSSADIIQSISFPFHLLEKYSEQITLTDCTTWLGIMTGDRGSDGDPLKTTSRINLFSYASKSNCHGSLRFFIIGRWK